MYSSWYILELMLFGLNIFTMSQVYLHCNGLSSLWKVNSSMITNTGGAMARFDPLPLDDTAKMTPLERLQSYTSLIRVMFIYGTEEGNLLWVKGLFRIKLHPEVYL